MSSTKFWYLLLDSATGGQPYKSTTADFVLLPPGSVVAEFRKLAYREHASILTDIAPSQLRVYKNRAAFDGRNNDAAKYEGEEQQPLNPTQSTDGLGSMEDMLVVAVPSPRIPSQSTTDSIPKKEPDQKRKERWNELNIILDGNTKKSRTNDSTEYSSITWSQVKSIFAPSKYVQPQRAVDDAQLDFLAKYLSFTTKCFDSITDGKEAQRLHFIAPILVCVCFLLDGVTIVVEEDLVGNYVKAHGRFEFMLKRKNTAICIVEAKKDDIDQGMAQDLVGCEVAAEVGKLDVVYGIVTNYVQWNFCCSRNDKVEFEECSLHLKSYGPHRESLKEIVEKIYSMLSD
ncbi:hypothetical protein ACHAXH_001004 [Discostella pseudostelligera]